MAKSKLPQEVPPDLLQRLKERFGDFPLTRNWNLDIQELKPGKARMGLVPNEYTTNVPTDIVNGGVLATLADITCALALCTRFDGNMPFATSDLHIRYLEPAQGELTVEASVLRSSPRSAILECRIRCGSTIAAHCTAHFIIQVPAETPA